MVDRAPAEALASGMLATLGLLLIGLVPAPQAPQSVYVRFELGQLPASTRPDAVLSLATNVTGWDPAHECCRFERTGAGYVLSLRVPRGALLEYKLTRGSWATVETRADGSPHENRTLDVLASVRIRLQVERWADDPGPRPAARSTRSGTLERLADVESPELGNRRDVWVSLPPGYATSRERYPVLYLHDGQNVFDRLTSFVQQEWGADEAALHSARAGRPLIVVAVDAAQQQPLGPGRLSEYGPWPVAERGNGSGARYVGFLVDTLKPLIDARYRTLPGRATTGLCGSSMGGLISLFGALSRPDVFGFAGALSPSLWWADEAVFPWAEQLPAGPPVRVYLDTGDREGVSLDEAAQTVERTGRMAALLRRKGHDVRSLVARGGRHNEDAWARRFPGVLGFFLHAPG